MKPRLAAPGPLAAHCSAVFPDANADLTSSPPRPGPSLGAAAVTEEMTSSPLISSRRNRLLPHPAPAPRSAVALSPSLCGGENPFRGIETQKASFPAVLSAWCSQNQEPADTEGEHWLGAGTRGGAALWDVMGTVAQGRGRHRRWWPARFAGRG